MAAVSSSARWGCCGKMRPLDSDGCGGGCGGCGGSGGDGGCGGGGSDGDSGSGGDGNAGGDAGQSSTRRSDVSRISWSEIGHGSNGRAQNGASTGGIARSSNACTLVLLNAYLMREAIRQAISGNQRPSEGLAHLMREAIRRHQRGSRTRNWTAHQATDRNQTSSEGLAHLMREAIRRHQRGSRTRNWMAHQATDRTAAPARTIRSTRRAPRGTTRSRRIERARCGRAARSRALRTSFLMREVMREVHQGGHQGAHQGAHQGGHHERFERVPCHDDASQEYSEGTHPRQSEAIRGSQRHSEAYQ